MSRKITLTLLFTLILPLTSLAETKPKKLHPELAGEYTDFAAGKTLAELRAKAKPTLVSDEKNPNAIWIWISKSSVDTPVFTIASPYQTPQKTFAILSAKDDYPIPSITEPSYRERFVTIVSKIPAKPRSSYAAIAATHPDHGTLFQIGYRFSSTVCGSSETRIFLLQSPKNSWRFVAEINGNYMDDAFVNTAITRKIEWTDNPKAPVKITIRNSSPADRQNGTIETCNEFILAGNLPAKPKFSDEQFIIVPQDATFSGICSEIVGSMTDIKSKTGKKFLEEFKTDVKKLNPNLNPNQINAGQKLLIPNWDCGC